MLTPENTGCSQTACNIVNKTFFSLDGFAKMRQDMVDTTYTAEQFGAELAKITDREIRDGATLGLENDKPRPKPPKGCRWVEVDPFDFESADDGNTTHYGGEIRISSASVITNTTNVDIIINCEGDDRSDDECYWPTTEAVLDALFVDGVPGIEDGDYATHWEDFHDTLCGLIQPMADQFYVYLDQRGVPHRNCQSVVVLDASGNESVYPIP